MAAATSAEPGKSKVGELSKDNIKILANKRTNAVIIMASKSDTDAIRDIIQDMDTLIEKLNYCHKNPITRRLVERPEDWHWSSYRYYELKDSSVLPMDWNGSMPIMW